MNFKQILIKKGLVHKGNFPLANDVGLKVRMIWMFVLRPIRKMLILKNVLRGNLG